MCLVTVAGRYCGHGRSGGGRWFQPHGLTGCGWPASRSLGQSQSGSVPMATMSEWDLPWPVRKTSAKPVAGDVVFVWSRPGPRRPALAAGIIQILDAERKDATYSLKEGRTPGGYLYTSRASTSRPTGRTCPSGPAPARSGCRAGPPDRFSYRCQPPGRVDRLRRQRVTDLVVPVAGRRRPRRGVTAPPPIEDEPPASGGQGWVTDQQAKRAVERRAEDVVRAYLEASDWKVSRTKEPHPYDFLPVKGRQEPHVEVKGTHTNGQTVWLTTNEIDHAEKHPKEAVLAIVSGIEVRGAVAVPGSGPSLPS